MTNSIGISINYYIITVQQRYYVLTLIIFYFQHSINQYDLILTGKLL